jgi:hypothetical protein
MKNLITEIATDFKYTEGEYYFSTTIEGIEYVITSTIREGYAMYTEFLIDGIDSDRDEVNKLLNELTHEGECEMLEKEATDKDLEETNNSLTYNFD